MNVADCDDTRREMVMEMAMLLVHQLQRKMAIRAVQPVKIVDILLFCHLFTYEF